MPILSTPRALTHSHFALLLLSVLAGCRLPGTTGHSNTLPRAVVQALQQHTPVDAALVKQDNAFGFALFNHLRHANGNANLCISPVSLALALQIVYNGADGDTRRQMAKALQIADIPLPTLNANNSALQASLVSPDPKVQLTVVNGLWTKQNKILPAFVNTVQSYYHCELGSTDGLPDTVNTWVSKQTQGRISSILPPDDYRDTIAVIANAVYFKATWTDKFESYKTENGTFTIRKGSTQPCKLMTQQNRYDHYAGKSFQMVRLPYGSKRLSMLVLLPNAGVDLDTVLTGLNAQSLSECIAKFKPATGNVQLPRFTSTYDVDLKDGLSKLGMGVAFDLVKANFRNLATPESLENFYLSRAYHKTYVQVDEEGTEAAAATSIETAPGSAGAALTDFTMRMDHPFFYAIRDDQTGVLLFMGILTAPSPTPAS